MEPSHSFFDRDFSKDKDKLKGLLQKLDELPCSPSCEDDIWYVVNKKFLDKLRLFAFQENSEGNTQFPVLIRNKKFLEDDFNVNTKTRLLDEYKNGNGINFVLYPVEGIELLEEYFHFDIRIPRSVYPFMKAKRNNKITYKVDIQPMKVTVYSKNPNVYPNPPKSVIIILKKYTIEDILIEINGGFKDNHLKRNLFFADDFYDTAKEWQCLFLSKSSEYNVEKKICEFDINERSCFLITSERPDLKCLKNDNENYNDNDEFVFGSREDPLRTQDDDSLSNANIQFIFDNGGDRGLINLGNTCFLNSSLQCLSKILKFSNYFLSGTFWKDINYSNPVGQNGKLAKAYYETLMEMWKINKKNAPYAPRIIKQSISEKRDEFYGYQQHDSQELLAYLLDGLHEDLNLITKKPYYEEKLQGGLDKSDVDVAEASWKRHKEINNSIIVDLFQGQYRSRLKCPQCQKVSITFDPFMYLSIPLPQKKNHRIWFHVIINRESPSCLRFSCSFKGNQEVYKLKMFCLNVIKTLKVRKKNVFLHNKSIIRNQEENKEDNYSFNFHWKCLNEYADINDDSNENEDLINYANIIKEKKSIHTNFTDSDIELIYESICKICNITNIDQLELLHIAFFYTKLKNLACNSFFQVLYNTDTINEPCSRAGQGISHIYVFLVPSVLYNHLIEKPKEINMDDNMKMFANSNSTQFTSSSSFSVSRNCEKNTKTTKEENISEFPDLNSIGKMMRKRKVMSPDILTKDGENIDSEEEEDTEKEDTEKEDTENEENREEQESGTKIEEEEKECNECVNNVESNNLHMPKIGECNKYINQLKKNEKGIDIDVEEMCNNTKVIFTNGVHNINDDININCNTFCKNTMNAGDDMNKLEKSYFTILIVPLCKEDHPLYRMKNNDLPILFNAPMNITSMDLHKKAKEGYSRKRSIKRTISPNKEREASEEAKVSNKLSNIFEKIKNEEENQYNNKETTEKKMLNGTLNTNDENDRFVSYGLDTMKNTNEEKLEANKSILYKEKNANINSCMKTDEDEYFDLYIPCYYLKDEFEPQSDLGIELKRDKNTLLCDYLKDVEGDKIIIIYLNSRKIDRELSNDIKTLTFIDLEEKYGIGLCLKLFSEEEHLDENNTWYCNNCKLHVQAYKKLDLFRMPTILILHLKRFNNTNRWIRSKIDSYVYYPHKENEFLNMTPYILPDGLAYMKKQIPNYEPLYELIAVNCHTGSLSGGHYFAYVKLRNSWYNFNDSFVSKVDESDVNTKNAYLLFYQLLSHKNEKFDSVFQSREMTEEQAIAIANASYYG